MLNTKYRNMKTIITFLILLGFGTSPTVKVDNDGPIKKSGQITYETVYKETQGFGMSSATGTPERQKVKMGTDFKFDYFFNERYSRYQKIEKKEEGQPQRRVSFSSFSFGGGSGSEGPDALKFDEFDTTVFDFEENLQYGLATVFEKELMVEVPLSKQDLGFEVSKTKKKIAGYNVTEAISSDGNIKVWFTKELDIHSFWQYDGIDGVVLGFEDQSRTVTASKIDMKSVPTSMFELPDRKLIELEQYQDLKKEEADERMKSIQKRMKESGKEISFENGGITIKKGGNN